MICSKPFVRGMHVFGCGQCLPCRISRRRIWAHRLLLEKLLHPSSVFVTLTYSDCALSVTPSGQATLVLRDLQLWLKRFRKAIGLQRIRYFACGEYGDETGRPHYHAALFGVGGCAFGLSRYSARRLNCCVMCDLVRDTWGLGNIFLGELTEKSAQYIVGYVVKKMTSVEDKRLNGRLPEFARMSLRPGIGAGVVERVAVALDGVDFGVDVPVGLRHGSKVLPLGRYLRSRLRVAVGRDRNEPIAASLARSRELHPLYAVNVLDAASSVQKQLVALNLGRVRSVVARAGVYKARKRL